MKEDIARFESRVGYIPDLEHPTTHGEHVMRKKYTDRNPLLTTTADKIAVREYVAKCAGSHILVPIIEASYGQLTNISHVPCVAKANNGSGRMKFVETMKDVSAAIKMAKQWLMPYGQEKGEWCYKDISPGYVIEPVIWKRGERHTIYRWLCWHGIPRYIEAHEYEWTGRKPTTIYHTMFRVPWDKVDVTIDGRPTRDQASPTRYYDMYEIATALSKPFDFVRVDLFEHLGNVRISELTHYPRSGQYRYDPQPFDLALGKLW